MTQITQSVSLLIDQFAKLPGIGRKSAERLAYHILRVHENEALQLADSIRDVKQNVRYCERCYNLSEEDTCPICQDTQRDQTLMCIVEQPRDLIALEQSGMFRGLYHVLLGRIAPLEGVGPDQLTIEPLVDRVREGDGTSLHISNLLADFPVKLTRLARGITTGSVLEFTNKEILADALSGRQSL